MRLFLKEIMELLPSALSSSQWGVKAQAARALGTVSRKLGTNITRETQASIITLLLAGLEGKTWSSKETLLKALADTGSGAPEIIRENISDDRIRWLVDTLLKECRKEKVDYKITARSSSR